MHRRCRLFIILLLVQSYNTHFFQLPKYFECVFVQYFDGEGHGRVVTLSANITQITYTPFILKATRFRT